MRNTPDVHTKFGLTDDCFRSLSSIKIFTLSVLRMAHYIVVLLLLLGRLLLSIFFSPHQQYVCGKMQYCFMLALWPRTPRGRRAASFILLRVNCCDRALRGPSLARCPLRSKEAALILSVLLNLPTQTRL